MRLGACHEVLENTDEFPAVGFADDWRACYGKSCLHDARGCGAGCFRHDDDRMGYCLPLQEVAVRTAVFLGGVGIT